MYDALCVFCLFLPMIVAANVGFCAMFIHIEVSGFVNSAGYDFFRGKIEVNLNLIIEWFGLEGTSKIS